MLEKEIMRLKHVDESNRKVLQVRLMENSSLKKEKIEVFEKLEVETTLSNVMSNNFVDYIRGMKKTEDSNNDTDAKSKLCAKNKHVYGGNIVNFQKRINLR